MHHHFHPPRDLFLFFFGINWYVLSANALSLSPFLAPHIPNTITAFSKVNFTQKNRKLRSEFPVRKRRFFNGFLKLRRHEFRPNCRVRCPPVGLGRPAAPELFQSIPYLVRLRTKTEQDKTFLRRIENLDLEDLFSQKTHRVIQKPKKNLVV